MLGYAVRRVLLMIPTFFGITFLSFAMLHLAPGDPVEMHLAGGLESGTAGISTQKLADMAKAKAELRHELGLDRAIPVQYAFWLGRLVRGDLGFSYKDRQPVWDKIKERLPVTIMIDVLALLITYMIALPLGIWSAVRPGSLFDQVSTVGIFLAYSLPSFWIGVLLIVYFCGGDYFNWFPPGGLRSLDASAEWSLGRRLGDLSWHLALPLFVTTLGSYTELSRYVRSSMLETARQDYIRTARAKGVPERSVVLKHMLRNSLIPMVTILAGILPGLISGSVIIESIFSIPGIGQLGYRAALARDYPVILALLSAGSLLTLLGILLADLALALVDPRISFARSRS
jgi:peptide/nickel transport system permease protein